MFPWPRWVIPAGAAALLLACIAALSAIGEPRDALGGLSSVLFVTISAGGPALAYLLAAAGLGRLFARLFRGSPDAAAFQAALGLALMLSLSHLLGVLGLFSGSWQRPAAAAPIALGLGLLAHQLLPHRGDVKGSIPVAWLAGVPALALLLVAASQPPGWLWDSEAGGYDALSYHLQLPKEWLANGRLWPLQHNVFSFLPSYVEAAFLHLAALLGGQGESLLCSQFLSAGIALLAVGLLARLGAAAGRRAGVPCSGAIPALIALCTPWTIVVGSLAYNDLAVVALLGAALLAAIDPDLAPARRAAIAALLVGVACGCKPTALLFGAPVAIGLLWSIPPRRWFMPLCIGAAVGLATLAPWLIRNWLACGNPVFPQAASVFGPAHWSADQLHRYAAATTFHGSLLDRLRLMVLPDATDPAGARHRGLFHPQWLAFFGLAGLAAAAALARRATRPIALVMAAGLAAQLLAWLFLTHIQSRFLLPLLVPSCALLALHARTWEKALGFAAAFVQLGASVAIFAGQRGGNPNAMLSAGPDLRTGAALRAELAALPPQERNKALSTLGPEAFCNLVLPSAVYLLGDATPLYYTVPVLYNTTWDAWPLGEAMRRNPGDPAAWTASLLARGVRFVLVNPSEIDRLTRSGWVDPSITPEAVSDWLARTARPVNEWPASGLFELLPSTPRGNLPPAPAPDPTR